MARRPHPWFRVGRGWFVTVKGKQHSLGVESAADEAAAFAAFKQLMELQDKLERHFCEMQDIEFTVERGKLYLLQTRTGKRTTAAALVIAADMVKEGLIDESEAVQRLDPEQLDQLLHRVISPSVRATAIATGLPASRSRSRCSERGMASGAMIWRKSRPT